MLNLIDISPLISERTAVYPGDPAFRRETILSHEKGDGILLSGVSISLHLGAHTDAPVHYGPGGAGIAERSLHPYLGLCQVIAVDRPVRGGTRLFPEDLVHVRITTPRVLLKTGSYPDPENWTDEFWSTSPELIDSLARAGVVLIGIDTPSIDPADSVTFESHATVLKNDLSILEGIDLRDVSPGLYDLIALPLRIEGGDASPVRAVLLPAHSLRG